MINPPGIRYREGIVMLYHSTQDKSKSVSSAQAIAQGISKEGGLFVPEIIPQITPLDLRAMLDMDYR